MSYGHTCHLEPDWRFSMLIEIYEVEVKKACP